MRYIVSCMLLLVFFTSNVTAQYFDDRVTEKSFENSQLFFNSHFLHPFGLLRFKNVAPGLVDDPFLNLYLNPANLPQLADTTFLTYLDFRGDRTKVDIVRNYITPLPYQNRVAVYIDPRWYQITRSEPEPIFSFGALGYLGKKNSKKVFIGGTYQIINRAEPFYSVPAWIYAYRYGYDAFGAKQTSAENIPIEDRKTGSDEMMTSGHLFSGFLGWKINSKLNIGISANGVIHSRDGIYSRFNKDEYGTNNNSDWLSLYQRQRSQDYKHLDFSTGIRYRLTPSTAIGLKLGYLNGKANQNYNAADSSFYFYSREVDNLSHYYHRYVSEQKWEQKGRSRYGRILLSKEFRDGRRLNFYYRFESTVIDLSSRSVISDTSFSTYRWQWDNASSFSEGYSSLEDKRKGWGQRKRTRHTVAMYINLPLSSKNIVYSGIYFSRENLKIGVREPVYAVRESFYKYFYSPNDVDTTYYYNYRQENKEMHWNYRALQWSIQIPVLMEFRINKNWHLILGITRILNNWRIKDETLAIYQKRITTRDGKTTIDRNFGERFRNPDRKISENFTDVITNLRIFVTPRFRINFLLDPEFKEVFRVAQWWLSFQADI